MQREGIDPRHWVSYGTVATQKSDGTYDVTDAQAVSVSPDGCFVDVLLHPLLVHVTCRYPGVHGGSSAQVMAPVRPGDEVLVALADGDLRMPPVVEKVMTAQHSPLTLDADGRTPLWKNDRVLIFGRDGKVQVRAAGGAEVVVNLDGSVEVTGTKVTLGAPDASQQLMLGTAYRDAQAALDDNTTGLQFQFNGLQGAAVGPLAPLKPFFLAIAKLYGVFEGKAGQYLSQVSKTK